MLPNQDCSNRPNYHTVAVLASVGMRMNPTIPRKELDADQMLALLSATSYENQLAPVPYYQAPQNLLPQILYITLSVKFDHSI